MTQVIELQDDVANSPSIADDIEPVVKICVFDKLVNSVDRSHFRLGEKVLAHNSCLALSSCSGVYTVYGKRHEDEQLSDIVSSRLVCRRWWHNFGLTQEDRSQFAFRCGANALI